MKRNDQAYLHHLLDAISRIAEYTKGFSREEFKRNKLVQDAVIRQLEIVGEATKYLSDATKELAPLLPWKDMAGMRDVLIHQYFGVDIDAVWQTIQDDLRAVETEIKRIVRLPEEQ